MRSHTSNELIYRAAILDTTATTVITTAFCGIEDLSGKRLEQAQIIAAETTHRITMRANDARQLTNFGHITVEGVLYIVDYLADPRKPRPNMWLEVFCHVERSGNAA